MHTLRVGLGVVAALGLVSCATTPKPCTPEWVDWKTTRLLDEFATNHSQQIDSLRQVTAGFQVGKIPRPMESGIALVQAGLLGAQFLTDAAPEVNSVLDQCPTSTTRAKLIADMLRRRGFSEGAAKWVEDLGAQLDKKS